MSKPVPIGRRCPHGYDRYVCATCVEAEKWATLRVQRHLPNQPENTMTEQRIDEIVDNLVKLGKSLQLSNYLKNKQEYKDSCRAKIKAYREELKQLLKESYGNNS